MASHSNFFFTLLLSCSVISLIDASKNGITVDLIHRDSPLSPFYNPNKTRIERLRNAFHRSFARKASLNPTSISSTDTIQALLMNSNVGEYLMQLSIGTPPVEILVIADTGSDLLWTQCLPCSECNATFLDPRMSTSYRNLSCQSNLCHAFEDATCEKTQKSNCTYKVSYRDGSYSNGDLAMETISLQSNSGGSLSYKVAFGCGHDNHYTSEEPAAAKTGIVGLGGGDLSLVNQLYTSSIGGKFSYCLAQSDGPSKISFGSNALVLGPNVVSTPLKKKSDDTHYYLSLEGVTVGTNRINNGTIYNCSTDQCDIMIDSGTMLTFLPDQFYQELESALRQVIKEEEVSDGEYPLCYLTNGGDFEAPKIVFHFTGADLELSSRNTFLEKSGKHCLTMLPPDSDDHLAIFGNLNQRDYHIGYDLVNNKVSFMPTDCSNSKFP